MKKTHSSDPCDSRAYLNPFGCGFAALRPLR